MSQLWAAEEHVNLTRDYRLGQSAIQECFTENVGELFRCLQREYGRCVSKVYIDTKQEEAVPIGWVFQKRVEYCDCRETYLQEVWVTLFQGPKGPHRRLDRR